MSARRAATAGMGVSVERSNTDAPYVDIQHYVQVRDIYNLVEMMLLL
jgi:hypothetical protein